MPITRRQRRFTELDARLDLRPINDKGDFAVRKLIVVGCALAIAACAPVQEKPTPKETPKQTYSYPRFDGLAALSETASPERDGIREKYRYDRSIKATAHKGLRYYFYEPNRKRNVVGFSFNNSGSPKVNPVGMKKKGPRREYAFLFADRARENIYLAVNDDVKISGRFSHDNMFREVHFFPRKQLPSLTSDHSKGVFKVTLPTGEPVLFDQDTYELVGGAMKEGPIDFNRSRHARRNPDVRYTGKYLAITVAQRGEAPRRSSVWGQQKFAEAHYPAKYKKSCRLSPKHIWDQRPKRGDNDPKLTMLHKTDDAIFAVVERQCGWDLSALKSGSSRVADAASK